MGSNVALIVFGLSTVVETSSQLQFHFEATGVPHVSVVSVHVSVPSDTSTVPVVVVIPFRLTGVTVPLTV